MPLAYFTDRYKFPFKKTLTSAILLPIMLPPFVGAIGIQQIFSTYGVLNAILLKLGMIEPGNYIDWLGSHKFLGIALMNALSLYPILYLSLVAALANIDPSLDEAAGNLGCRGLKRFFKITFPLLRPGIFAGCTLIFIWAFTELGVPLMFDYNRVTPVQIYFGLKDIGNNPLPFALVSVMLGFSVLFYILGKGLLGRQTFSMMAKSTHLSGPRNISVPRQLLCTGSFLVVIMAALLPHLAVIIKSFSADWYNSILPDIFVIDNYKRALSHPLTVPSIKNSLIYSSMATVGAILLGTAIAFVVVRTKFPGRHILDTLSMMPLAVPGLVMAFGYLAMTQTGRTFEILNPIENPTALLIIAYIVRKIPFAVRSAMAGLQQTSITYEEAAQCLGCHPFKTSLKITLPLITANLISGGLLVFSQAMLEVSDSIVLAQKQQYYPITKAIYELMHMLSDGPFLACALGVWAMTFLAVTVIGTSSMMGKSFGAIFRV
jgi:iron(III) transport system permease protein